MQANKKRITSKPKVNMDGWTLFIKKSFLNATTIFVSMKIIIIMTINNKGIFEELEQISVLQYISHSKCNTHCVILNTEIYQMYKILAIFVFQINSF